MAKQHGRLAAFTWGGTAVGDLTNGAPNFTRAKLDCTTRSSGDAREYISDRLEGSISISGLWNEADSGQAAMLASFLAGTSAAVTFRMNTGSGLHHYAGSMLIENFNPGAPDGVADLSIDATFTGTITKSVQ